MSEAAEPVVAPPTAPPAKTEKHPRPALTMAQQRFRLALVAIVSLMVSLYVTAALLSGDIRTAILAILVTSFGGPVRDVFRHYFPGGASDAVGDGK